MLDGTVCPDFKSRVLKFLLEYFPKKSINSIIAVITWKAMFGILSLFFPESKSPSVFLFFIIFFNIYSNT